MTPWEDRETAVTPTGRIIAQRRAPASGPPPGSGSEGNPHPAHVSTSYAERHNPTDADGDAPVHAAHQRVFKKFENHVQMVALYTIWYNFVKQHKSLKGVSPAMAAGVSDMLWSMEDIAELVEAAAPEPGPRGPYKNLS